MIVCGVVVALLAILNIWVCDNWKIIINIISTLGGGVVCSAIVSWLVEASNDKRLKEERKRQREYILSSLKFNLNLLLRLEVRCMSAYSILIENEDNKEVVSSKITIKEACLKIKGYLEKINNSTVIRHGLINDKTDSDYLKRVGVRNNFAYGNTLSSYTHIFNILSNIMEESNNYYIGGVFDKEIIEAIKGMQVDVNSIIQYSNENSLDLLVEFKHIFYANVLGYLDTLKIDINEIIGCSVRQLKTAQ